MIGKSYIPEGTKTVTFQHQDEESHSMTVRHYTDLTPWPDILQDFLRFLESTGYVGVIDRVSIENSPFLSDKWEGPVHDAEEDDWK